MAMRHVIRKIVLLSAALMITVLPVMAGDGAVRQGIDPAQQGEKNECLLVAMNCGNQVDSIQQRIERIQQEIGRGSAVYTNDELRRLQGQLDDANRTLNELTVGSGA